MPYTLPTADELQTKYPAFAAVSDVTVDVHIADAAAEGVDASWREDDYQPAVMALAAHTMTLLGIGEQSEAANFQRQGVSNFRSGNFSASFSGAGASAAANGELAATVYGQTYRRLLRRNKAGPRVLPGAGTAGSA